MVEKLGLWMYISFDYCFIHVYTYIYIYIYIYTHKVCLKSNWTWCVEWDIEKREINKLSSNITSWEYLTVILAFRLFRNEHWRMNKPESLGSFGGKLHHSHLKCFTMSHSDDFKRHEIYRRARGLQQAGLRSIFKWLLVNWIWKRTVFGRLSQIIWHMESLHKNYANTAEWRKKGALHVIVSRWH